MTKCTKCGTENHAGAKFCRLCGTPLAPAVKAAAGAASAPQPAPTQALTHTPQFSPLAKGELLLEDRYEVMEPLSQSAARNTYIVKDGGCGKCGKFSGKGANYCEFCGAGLAQPRHYLLIEGSSERDVAGERLLAQCGVSGRRLINYHRAFEAAPAGTLIRSYVLADPVVTRQTPGAVCARRLTDLPPLSIDDAGR